MTKNKKNAFTLVELLAVIVILAIILVIAVPEVMNIIGDAQTISLPNWPNEYSYNLTEEEKKREIIYKGAVL